MISENAKLAAKTLRGREGGIKSLITSFANAQRAKNVSYEKNFFYGLMVKFLSDISNAFIKDDLKDIEVIPELDTKLTKEDMNSFNFLAIPHSQHMIKSWFPGEIQKDFVYIMAISTLAVIHLPQWVRENDPAEEIANSTAITPPSSLSSSSSSSIHLEREKSVEIVVIDNISPERQELIRKFQNKLSSFILVTEENQFQKEAYAVLISELKNPQKKISDIRTEQRAHKVKPQGFTINNTLNDNNSQSLLNQAQRKEEIVSDIRLLVKNIKTLTEQPLNDEYSQVEQMAAILESYQLIKKLKQELTAANVTLTQADLKEEGEWEIYGDNKWLEALAGANFGGPKESYLPTGLSSETLKLIDKKTSIKGTYAAEVDILPTYLQLQWQIIATGMAMTCSIVIVFFRRIFSMDCTEELSTINSLTNFYSKLDQQHSAYNDLGEEKNTLVAADWQRKTQAILTSPTDEIAQKVENKNNK